MSILISISFSRHLHPFDYGQNILIVTLHSEKCPAPAACFSYIFDMGDGECDAGDEWNATWHPCNSGQHVFVWRPADDGQKKLYFSATFSTDCQDPSLKEMYAYTLVHAATDSQPIPPESWGNQNPEDKRWVSK